MITAEYWMEGINKVLDRYGLSREEFWKDPEASRCIYSPLASLRSPSCTKVALLNIISSSSSVHLGLTSIILDIRINNCKYSNNY